MELYRLSANDLAKGIRNKEFTSVQVVQSFIERIQRVNKDINAIAIMMFENAISEAITCDQMLANGELRGPLHGVPVTIKESIHLVGTPSTWGIEGKDELIAEDDPSVARLKKAGAIILAKTNAMQLLMGCETFNPIYGRTNNPWNLERTSGGSSGGEGAAIAYLCSSLGLGTDIGGSIRTPAHFCGIHGLKPTPGIIPQHPPQGISHIQREASSMSSIGPLARTVGDLTLAFEILSEQTMNIQRIKGLKIGVWTNDHILPPSPSITRIIKEAGHVLEEAGAEVVPYELPQIKENMQYFFGMMCGDGGKGIDQTMGLSKQEYPIQKIRNVQKMGNIKRKLAVSALKLLKQEIVSSVILPFTGAKTKEEYQELVSRREEYQALILNDLRDNNIDALICPIFPTPALYHNGSKNLSYEGAYNSLINFLGFPAGAFAYSFVRDGEEMIERDPTDKVLHAAMEAEKNSVGLPVGLQVVSIPHHENIVLSIMDHLEQSSQLRSDYPPKESIVVFK
ncbi:amidase [Paenibacillus macquariensis]|uniref:Fatty acid amide hydrolase n=1 Tax=Paenibacillus macquariensis TaxID=948756 RepID=A0ABY1JP71_9BACL|nr:amidase family protein [Paenibacillus macquariensis]MEC0092007.1 amidase family protein [Paenibacillus macquariensis]OAB37422.1 hypothetical protein PMSM_04990 [Paenibacillus macquariensis subsp. macquariensis]SIQ52828.1 fatty acid amide hydrolase [Paenibacillus macquariensis]